MKNCKKCGNKLLTVSTYVSDWDADQEPYKPGVSEDHDGINSPVNLTAQYCEKCEAFDGIYFEAEMIDKAQGEG